jgi:hypothetical protein
MHVSRPTITQEQRQALILSGGSPVQLEDPETSQVYLLVEQPMKPELDETYVRAALQVAINELASGQEEDWDIESVLAEAQREFAEGR